MGLGMYTLDRPSLEPLFFKLLNKPKKFRDNQIITDPVELYKFFHCFSNLSKLSEINRIKLRLRNVLF